jgi:hypothetical protein
MVLCKSIGQLGIYMQSPRLNDFPIDTPTARWWPRVIYTASTQPIRGGVDGNFGHENFRVWDHRRRRSIDSWAEWDE